MPSFDVASSVDFDRPTERCPHCLALWPDGIGPTEPMTGLASIAWCLWLPRPHPTDEALLLSESDREGLDPRDE
jgi:hypothetical protein